MQKQWKQIPRFSSTEFRIQKTRSGRDLRLTSHAFHTGPKRSLRSAISVTVNLIKITAWVSSLRTDRARSTGGKKHNCCAGRIEKMRYLAEIRRRRASRRYRVDPNEPEKGKSGERNGELGSTLEREEEEEEDRGKERTPTILWCRGTLTLGAINSTSREP